MSGKLLIMTRISRNQAIQISLKPQLKGLLQNIEALSVVLSPKPIDFLSRWIGKNQRVIFSVTIKKHKKEHKAKSHSY
jgi:hypothetical protein